MNYSNTVQYCVYTHNANFVPVMQWVQDRELEYEVHLNRTRFWVPKNTPVSTEFMLRWFHCTSEVVD